MRKQIVIIGLGQFGTSLAQTLSERGLDVLAIDRKPERVQLVSAFVSEAMCFDANDQDALARVAPQKRDVCVCAIGDESRESAILVTAVLRQLGARRVIARATDDLMERILRLVGAHEVVNPERAFGQRLANRMLYRGVLDEIPLGDDLVITEVELPPEMVGRDLIELDLRSRFGITVIALRRDVEGKGTLLMPEPREPIRAGDILVVVSRPGAVNAVFEGG